MEAPIGIGGPFRLDLRYAIMTARVVLIRTTLVRLEVGYGSFFALRVLNQIILSSVCLR